MAPDEFFDMPDNDMPDHDVFDHDAAGVFGDHDDVGTHGDPGDGFGHATDTYPPADSEVDHDPAPEHPAADQDVPGELPDHVDLGVAEHPGLADPEHELPVEPNPAESEYGVDPDGYPIDDSFPAQLDVDVTPSDGGDWVDAGALGSPTESTGPTPLVGHDTASPDELLSSVHRSAGGQGEASWESLRSSDDPAIRALAAFWSPG